MLKLILGALLVLMARADTTGRKLVRGRSISSGSTGGNPGHNDALGVPTNVTATGNSGWIEASDISALLLSLAVSGTVTGTAPTLDVLVETSDDPAGATNVRTVGSFTQKTAAAAAGGQNERKTFAGIDRYYRVRWTIGGSATPTFNGVSITGEGK
jgi:hypothetical protein